MFRRSCILRVLALLTVLSVLPVGAAKYFTLYLTNGTKYYIDIWTYDYNYAYLPPGGTLVLQTAREVIPVYAYISAGQGITAAAKRTFETSYPEPSDIGTDCDGRRTYYGSGGGCIGKNVLEIEDGYPTEAHWEITWEDFSPPDVDDDKVPI